MKLVGLIPLIAAGALSQVLPSTTLKVERHGAEL
jgi:hypothetical protein